MEKTAGIRRRHASATAATVIALVLSTGSFYVTGPNLPHYSHAKTDALIQEQGIGPTGIEYVSAADDPRNAR